MSHTPPGRPAAMQSAARHPSAEALHAELANYVGQRADTAEPAAWARALAKAVRDSLVPAWLDTERRHEQADVKRAYYLSLEYLPGRQLANAMLARGDYDAWAEACTALGLDLDTLAETEHAPALGNGGLGRLAACLLDSLASCDLPGYAYGIRYRYGMFSQQIRGGEQTEAPEAWLADGHPWEIVRPEITYPVGFGGRVDVDGASRRWAPEETAVAVAHDMPVPGYHTDTVLTLRLWSAQPTEPFDLAAFNRGAHREAVAARDRCEDICRVLYPDDSTPAGRELRLRQEFFFCSAALQDILARHCDAHSDREAAWRALPERVAIHLNDTHPAIAVAELMRLLLDTHGLTWERAWGLCEGVFSYTNHTLMPEALESWPVELVGRLLPRHLEIIYEINARFVAEVRTRFPDDYERLRRLSLIDEAPPRSVRMAHLAVLASHHVNGVSALHGQLMVDHVFADFAALYPTRFTHVTNGVTPRRWLNQANPGLARLLNARIDPNWPRDLSQLAALTEHARDAGFRDEFARIKHANKQRLAAHIQRVTGIEVAPDSLFDVHIKRIHEYKRQLLNILGVITRYVRLIDNPAADVVPRTVIFAGKAASSYVQAKRIIRLIHDVAGVINADARVTGRLKVVFIPDYGVREAELIVPAADLSEQISTAGTEASGTGNMKLAMNGALTIGTEDGANIEIRDAVGADNIFIFGHDAAGIEALRAEGGNPWTVVDADAELAHVLYMIGAGAFSPDDPGRFRPLLDAVLDHGDHFKVVADYRAYVDAQDAVDARWRDRDAWLDAAIANVAGMGRFSSDAMARHYAADIWGLAPSAPATRAPT